MTKRRPARAKHPQIVVTPEMLEAGAKTLEQWENATTYDKAAAVYRAMSLAAPRRTDGYGNVAPTMLDALHLLGHRLPKK
jgi:hypothetical protein